MKCLKRNFKEDFLEFNKHFYADSKESTKTFYEVKSWATVSEVIKQMQKLSTFSLTFSEKLIGMAALH